jgi:hypothetical protein
MNESEILKTKIERMEKHQHIEILKLIKKYNQSVVTNENKNGTWINMSCLSETTMEELKKYISYIEEQEKSLNMIESEKQQLKKTYFIDSTIHSNP